MPPSGRSNVVAAVVVSESNALPSSMSTDSNGKVERKASSFVQLFARDFAAGGLASVLSKTAMAPIER